MTNPESQGTIITPAVDDELVFTVRIRLDNAETLHGAQGYLLDLVPARLLEPILELLNRHGMELAGIEVVTPTFKPYHTVFQRNEPLPQIGDDRLKGLADA